MNSNTHAKKKQYLYDVNIDDNMENAHTETEKDVVDTSYIPLKENGINWLDQASSPRNGSQYTNNDREND